MRGLRLKSVFIALFIGVVAIGQNYTKLTNINPFFIAVNDTFTVNGKNIDTAINYQLYWGSSKLKIVHITDSTVTAVAPSNLQNSYISLQDTQHQSMAYSSHPLFANYYDTSQLFKAKPHRMIDEDHPINLWDSSSSYINLFSDLNGDGLTDLVLQRNSNLYLLMNKTDKNWNVNFDTLVVSRANIYTVLELNGKGLPEILFYKNGQVLVCELTKNGSSYIFSDTTSFHQQSNAQWLDINADGLNDYVAAGWNFASQSNEIVYRLNKSKDSLSFDTTKRIAADSIRLLTHLEYTDSGSVVLAAIKRGVGLVALEIKQDTGVYAIRELAKEQYTSSYTSLKTEDLDFDGRKEVIISSNGTSYVYRFKDTAFSYLGEFEGNLDNLGITKCLLTDSNPTFLRSIKTNSYFNTRLQRIIYESDSVYAKYTDTLNYRYESSLFTDFNGDGFVDLLDIKGKRIYPSKVIGLETTAGTDTINFLQNTKGEILFDTFNYITNTGLEPIQIDSIYSDGSAQIWATDSVPLSYPVIVPPNEKIHYGITYKDTASENLEHLTIDTKFGKFKGVVLRGRLNQNPSFKIVSVTPSTFRPGDTLTVVLDNFRGNEDSTLAFFGTATARVLSLTTDTLKIIAPDYYNQEHLLVMDQVNKLVATSLDPYSMVFYNHNGLDFDVYTFRNNSSILRNLPSSGIRFDFLNNELIARYYNNNKTQFYRQLGSESFTEVGSLPFYMDETAPLNFDTTIDYYHRYSYPKFYSNSGSNTDTLPVQLDTLKILQTDNALRSIVDFDKDGIRDLLLQGSFNEGFSIYSAQFGKDPFDYAKAFRFNSIAPEYIQVSDLNKDGLADIILFNDTTIAVLQNLSRPGRFYFEEIGRVKRPFKHNLFRIYDVADEPLHQGVLVLDGYQNNIFLSHLFIDADTIRLDSIASNSFTNYTSMDGKFVDIDANGTLDVALTHHLMLNVSDSSTLAFKTSDRITRILPTFHDFNGDHLIDFYSSRTVYLNEMRKAETWSELEKAENDATYPLLKYFVSEPVILKSKDTAKYSLSAPLWLGNNGLVDVKLTSIQKPEHIDIALNDSFNTLTLPINVDSARRVQLFIRNNNQLYDSNYRDTLVFIYDRNDIVDYQEVKHVYLEFPTIDSIVPLSAFAGDTVSIFGKNLINNRKKQNLVRLYDRKLEVISATDSCYTVKVPSRHQGGTITLTDTINRLGAESGQKLTILRTGPGSTITEKYFELDTQYTSRSVSGWNNSDIPHRQIRLVDFNEDGNMDMYGHIYLNNGSSQAQIGSIIFDKDSTNTGFNWTRDLQMSYGQNGYSTFPKSLSSYIQDVNRDGKLNTLAIDAGSLCTPGSFLCSGATVSTPVLDSSFNNLTSTGTNYYYTGRYDKRSGEGELFHDFDKNGLPDVIWGADNYYVATLSDYYTYTLDTTNKETIVSKWAYDTIKKGNYGSSGFTKADLDGDGWVDIIDGGKILLNHSKPDSFAFDISYDLIDSFNYCGSSFQSRSLALQVVDLNGDNKPDLIGAGTALCGASGHKVWYINQSTPGKLKFISDTFHIYGASYLFNAFGDINGDGLTDLLAIDPPFSTNANDSIFIYTNRTDSVFKYELNAMHLEQPQALVLFDFDGDNDDDLLAVGFENSKYVYKHYLNRPVRARLTKDIVELKAPELYADSTTVWFVNSGTEELNVDTFIFSSNNPFLHVALPLKSTYQTLKAGDSLKIELLHKGDSIGYYKDTLKIVHNADGKEHILFINAETQPRARLKLIADSLQFIRTRVGDTSSFQYTLHNIGSDSLKITSVSIANSNFSISEIKDKIVAPADSLTGTLFFHPTDTALFISTAVIGVNTVQNRLNLILQGKGIAPLVKDTILYNAPNLKHGTSRIDSFYLLNTGTDTLNILSIDSTNHISLIQWPNKISALDSGLFIVKLRFDDPGDYTNYLTLKHNYFRDSTTIIKVTFTGLRGELGFIETQKIYNTKIDDVDSTTFYLVNTGNDTLSIDSIHLNSNSSFNFQVSGAFPLAIPKNDSTRINIRFKPVIGGIHIADLTVFSNSNESLQRVKILGSTQIDVDSVKVKQSSQTTISILNFSQDTVQLNNPKLKNSNGFQLGSFTPILLPPLDTAKGTLTFSPAAEGAYNNAAYIFWQRDSIAFNIAGYGTSPIVNTYRIIHLAPIATSATGLDSFYVYNTGSDTLFASSFSGTQRVRILSTFSEILPGDSAKLVFEYWSSSISNQQEFITIKHNYYVKDSSVYELRFFGQKPIYNIRYKEIGFGDLEIGKSYTKRIEFYNTGNIDLQIHQLKQFGDTQFRVNLTLPLSIKAGASAFVDCIYHPTERTNYEGFIYVYHNAEGDSSKVLFSGNGTSNWTDSLLVLDTMLAIYDNINNFDYFIANTGEHPLKIDSIKTINNNVQIRNYVNSVAAKDSGRISARIRPTNTTVQLDTHVIYHNHYRFNKTYVVIPYKAKDGVGSFTNRSLDFGDVAPGDTSWVQFRLTNSGDLDLELRFTILKLGKQFGLIGNINNTILSPGDSLNITAYYTPSIASIDTDTLYFISNSKSWSPNNYVQFVGRLKAGKLALAPETITVTKKLGKSSSTTFALSNTGSDSLTIDSITTSNKGLTTSTKASRLDTLETTTLTVKYPNNTQKAKDTLLFTIHHSGSNSPTLGKIYLTTIWPQLNIADSFVFDSTTALTQVQDSFWLRNLGTDTLLINRLTWLEGDHFSYPNVLPLSVKPSDSLLLKLTFNPYRSGYISDSLIIDFNGYPDSIKQVLVTGVATSTSSINGIVNLKNNLLFQNYPNPFSKRTTIGFYLVEPESCTLDLYNANGELVKEIYSGRGNAGYTFLSVENEELAAGTYTYVLNINGILLTKKLLIYN
jgi:hypothetical protein